MLSDSSQYMGCFIDKTSRAMGRKHVVSKDMTIDKCIADCKAKQYYFAGLQVGLQNHSVCSVI